MMLGLYRGATAAAAPLVRLYMRARQARGKEDAARIGERFGIAGRPRPDGRLVWLHAASVGESLSMVPLIEHLLGDRPALHILATSGTVTSARLLAERLPDRALHQYVPVDVARYVERFLDHWRPDLALWAESEFWPNLITRTHARGIPMVLVNGRVSPGALAGWRRAPGLIADILGCFTLCLGQTEEDVERLGQLGAAKRLCLGNLKFAAPPLPADEAELAALKNAIGECPRWLAASTHPGEETIAATVHRRLAADHPGLVTIIVPRHPGRGPEIARELRGDGFRVAVRSAGEPVGPDTELYLADTMGELGLFYRLAGIAFVGKSLVPPSMGQGGGQNPLEALRLGCVVVHGPYMTNFAEMTRRMDAAGAAIEVDGEAALAARVGALLDDESERARRAAAGHAFADTEAHVLDAVAAEIAPLVDGPRAPCSVHADA